MLIIPVWVQGGVALHNAAEGASGISIDEKLVQLMGKQSLQLAPTKTTNKENTALKKAILAQYAQVSVCEPPIVVPSLKLF